MIQDIEKLEGVKELEFLRQEIEKIKEESKDPHFQEINPKDLIDEDLDIYRKLRNKELTESDLNNYRDKIGSKEKSRTAFAEYVTNKLNIELIEKQLKKKE